MSVREREDASNRDISPVQVSNSVDERSGRPGDNQANKNPKTNKKEPKMERGDSLKWSWLIQWMIKNLRVLSKELMVQTLCCSTRELLQH